MRNCYFAALILIITLLALSACGTTTFNEQTTYTMAGYNPPGDTVSADSAPSSEASAEAPTSAPQGDAGTEAPTSAPQGDAGTDAPSNTPPGDTDPAPICEADIWISGLSQREQIGQLIMPRLQWQTTAVSPSLHNWFADYPVGGIILFSDNVDSIQQVQALTAGLQAASRYPLFIATDEEGGRVSRVGRLFNDLPTLPAYDIGRTGDPDAAYQSSRLIGERLLSLGINMNFAPVADVWTNPANTVIGNRAFGSDPETAGIMVDAAVRGLNSSGVLSTIKHFPGHGDTYEDSHYLLAVYHHDRARFDQVEAPPFMRGIDAGVNGVMMGHIATPQLQNPDAPLYWMESWLAAGTLPATFSDFWVQDVLRGQMGFEGLVITDALDMRAMTDHFTPAQIALGAFIAGADILLMPTDIPATFDALTAALEDGVFDEERLHESLRRIFFARQQLLN